MLKQPASISSMLSFGRPFLGCHPTPISTRGGRHAGCWAPHKVHAQGSSMADLSPQDFVGFHTDSSDAFDLENVRLSLIRQEDTTIFNIIERAQFARNSAIYDADCIAVPGPTDGSKISLLDYVLKGTEQLHGKIRRYTSLEEHAFYPDEIPPLILPPIQYRDPLPASVRSISVNKEIIDIYKNTIIPGITKEGDDRNYGSSSMHDVFCLQALSRRIHFGKLVAEAKFNADEDTYTHLINAKDANGIMNLLTNLEVENRVVERVRLKAATYGQDPTDTAIGKGVYKVHPDVVADIFKNIIMPLTKKLLQRLINHITQSSLYISRQSPVELHVSWLSRFDRDSSTWMLNRPQSIRGILAVTY